MLEKLAKDNIRSCMEVLCTEINEERIFSNEYILSKEVLICSLAFLERMHQIKEEKKGSEIQSL